MTSPEKGADAIEVARVQRAPAMVVAGPPGGPPYVDDHELERRTPIRRITWRTWRRQGVELPYYRARRRCVYRWAEGADGGAAS